MTYDNIDKVSDIAFLREHPVIFTGGIPYLDLGLFYNILSIMPTGYDAVSQIAIGEKGAAIRYHGHDTGEWSAWTKL